MKEATTAAGRVIPLPIVPPVRSKPRLMPTPDQTTPIESQLRVLSRGTSWRL